MVAFLLEGLAAAHARGLVHGSIMPSQIVCDAAGRPQLGPFGVHHLSGLIATRTGGLEEVLSMTAPELRGDAEPTTASDVFSVGAIYLALLVGGVGGDPSLLPPPERELVTRMLDPLPEHRPSAAEAFEQVRLPVADISRVAGWTSADPSESQRGRTMNEPGLGKAVVVTAEASWSDALLDALGSSGDPWLQTILDRDGRTWWLAPWPEGCRALPDDQDWKSLVAGEALDSLDPELARALTERMGPDAVVATPAGEWMIALDRLLTRAGRALPNV
jgi:serine/threonine protein kinase